MRIQSFFFIACLLSSSLVPRAHAGPGSDGGANSVKVCDEQTKKCEEKLIEQFHLDDLSQLKGYSIFQDKLALIRKELPELADAIEESAGKKQWYEIPAKFDLIEKDMIKTNFDTEQAAYQNDREVFVSRYSLDRMTDEAAAYKIMHEAVMAMQNPREVTAVRTLVSKIFDENPSAMKIQEAAAKNGFGMYFTQEQLKQQKRVVRLDYLGALDHALDFGQGRCRIQPSEWEKMLQGESGATRDAKEANLYGSFAKDTVKFAPMSASGWQLPFEDHPDSMGGLEQGILIGARIPPVLLEAKVTAAVENPQSYPKDFGSVLNDINNAASPRAKWSQETLLSNRDYHLEQAQADTAVIRKSLAQNESFVDLLAVQYVLAGSDKNWKETISGTEFDSIRPLLDRVAAKFHGVPRNRGKELFTRLCNDMASVQADVKKIQGKVGQKKSDAPVKSDLDLGDVSSSGVRNAR